MLHVLAIIARACGVRVGCLCALTNVCLGWVQSGGEWYGGFGLNRGWRTGPWFHSALLRQRSIFRVDGVTMANPS